MTLPFFGTPGFAKLIDGLDVMDSCFRGWTVVVRDIWSFYGIWQGESRCASFLLQLLATVARPPNAG
ncbi:hypothetical protein MAXJ12_12042 [Mesorhizobium alhagi CCNWXJ12-2]|jgi:hypothetical protein|uniref:Uncharacterized protein n=1 Tax=Mesorhizobium alhagi CCNWXJ12-2 TaxID=1107882 RepID=H0HQH8_9HYPH|nr:hypothetical protein MAXJ12_12042 [Mesorhizobium alhagi CCNWXJ12-2]